MRIVENSTEKTFSQAEATILLPDGGMGLTERRMHFARAVGRAWAERKADVLKGVIPAVDWPDPWSSRWTGRPPIVGDDLTPSELAALEGVAHDAAAERWAQLLRQHLSLEGAEPRHRRSVFRRPR